MRLAQNIETQETFVETALHDWKQVLAAWKQNHKLDCPMPMGHLMFEGTLHSYRSGFSFFGHRIWDS